MAHRLVVGHKRVFDSARAFHRDQSIDRLPAGSEIAVGKSVAGKALMFIHRGSYEALDSTYEAVTDYLDEKKLEGKDLFIEQYMKDPLSTPENDLVIEIYVPLK